MNQSPKLRFFAFLLILAALSSAGHARAQDPQPEDPQSLTFSIIADMRNYTGPGAYDSPSYFRGALEAIDALGVGAFLLSPGDLDPLTSAYWSITNTLGNEATWFPVIGNHELPRSGFEPSNGANLAWLNSYDLGTVNPGPSGCPHTTYSFDRPPAHFVVLNEYCNETGDHALDGDISDHLYTWLVADLQANTQSIIFVAGHEPAYVQPDADNGRLRHELDSLNQYPAHRDRFWNLLRAEQVTAYLCGHTHNFSAVNLAGVWQIDAGHARGLGDTGAASTFVQIQVQPGLVRYLVYRDDSAGGAYTLRHSGFLRLDNPVYLPLLRKEPQAFPYQPVWQFE
jgi:predicted phosphodiesterase